MYGFFLVFNRNIHACPNSDTLQNISGSLGNLEFDLSMSPTVHSNGAVEFLMYDLVFVL